MSATRRFVALAAALLAAAFVIANPASAATTAPHTGAAATLFVDSDIDGLLLQSGVDPVEGYAVQTEDRRWAPIRLADPTLVSLNKVLVPYSIQIVEATADLKTRHLQFVPTLIMLDANLVPVMPELVRPGPTPKHLVSYTFSGMFEGNKDLSFKVTVRGTLLPFPGKIFPFPKV